MRGTGLGRALILAVCDAASASGCRAVFLNCKEHNAAFYEKSGFERTPMSCFALYFDETR